jgi:1,4-alpha-glucan branching enzyme
MTVSINALLAYKEHDPHRFLGLHGQCIRLWRPRATSTYLEVLGHIVEAKRVDPAGLFEYALPKTIQRFDYRVFHSDGTLQFDPYAMTPFVGEIDAYLFNAGCHYEPYQILGAKPLTIGGIQGVHFAVWAPSAHWKLRYLGTFYSRSKRRDALQIRNSQKQWRLCDQKRSLRFRI